MLFVILFFILLGSQNQNQNQNQIYSNTMVIIEVENENVSLMDFNGFIYEFIDEDQKDWEKGDICSLIMDNNGTTDDITDDIIISVKYSGFVNEWSYGENKIYF